MNKKNSLKKCFKRIASNSTDIILVNVWPIWAFLANRSYGTCTEMRRFFYYYPAWLLLLNKKIFYSAFCYFVYYFVLLGRQSRWKALTTYLSTEF